ncbi:SulP family inorganic anion transporter [Reyranella sp.]|jgi:MFS superfamily sulfate permease-like transporter|uniref:SulP family inorganic anion transporter n=1 Tax=Reyranella sp. TaxID=1929291 RepID=UPI0025D452FA|nr:SulP family inorganic anion transporter [Reyranella sp.]
MSSGSPSPRPSTSPWLFASLRGYKWSWLSGDIMAGLMLVAIVLPGQIATAHLAGMPAEAGLMAFAAGSIAFAAVGGNRFISVGADSTIAPIFATVIAVMALGDPSRHVALAAILALLVGGMLVITGLLRAGWLADLLSVPVTTGFLAGISIHIIVGQLPGVLGVAASPDSHLLLRFFDVLGKLPQANPYAVTIGVAVLAATIGAHQLGPRIPGALFGLVAAALATWQFGLAARGVETLGALSAIVPSFSLPAIALDDIVALLPLAATVSLVCMMQTAAVARAFPSTPGVAEDVSRDFVGVGAGSLLAGTTGAFAVDASPPSTAIIVDAGGRSQMAQLLAVLVIGLLAALAGAAAAYVPRAALDAVLIYIALRIFHVGDMIRIARHSSGEIYLVVASIALVVLLPIQMGVGLAIVLSLIHSTYLLARPNCARLERLKGTTVWWPPQRGTKRRSPATETETVPGVLVFAPAAPLTFINADYIRGRLDAALAETGNIRLVVIEAAGITLIDYTGAQSLIETIERLRHRGIDVALARLEADRAIAAAQRSGLVDALGADHVFHSVEEAVQQRPAVSATTTER